MDSFTSQSSSGMEGLSAIANFQGFGGTRQVAALSVVFAAGARPTAEAVRALAAKSGRFSISLDPGNDSLDENGWVELLINGLTFDCSGLAPGPGEAMPPRGHNFAIPSETDFSESQAIALVPGPHLAGGHLMIPVIRSLAWLGALLAELPGAQAVCWHAARSYNGPEHFSASVLRWIEGGAFPGFGLTALAPTDDGGLKSEGLALLIGQEVRLAPELAADRANGAKLALRLIHWLVDNGGIAVPSHLAGPSGETLLLEPVNDQQIIKVSKSS